ncbi:hypothetical protein CARUB_v10018374mg [Capsella rubella]|uniref:F-box domain-containing protein n=1 Tax=Capsella rubella TaxID=81985 RepID=R0FRZ4_9BRAS|nr:putative F-box/LRR-repeat protein At3g44810 [Capsella rubella]EOA25066.1 hypothetical protein CARUB_v10018374mg [Capsella rubella]
MGSVSMNSLNCLPDELLAKILSFLPIKQAASTSLIAKRWRTLFAVRHNLDFDDSEILDPKVDEEDMYNVYESFWSFVDRTLALQGSVHINKFSLKCGYEPQEEDHVDGWINNALERGVSELHLHLTDEMRFRLPSNLFISNTLVKLTLGEELSIHYLPPNTFLPLLKILFLRSVRFGNQKFCDVLLAGCPALEDLTINGEDFSGIPEAISSKTIKRLSLISKSVDYDDLSSFMSLDTPNLVNLFYRDFPRRRYLIRCNLDSLVKAVLDLHVLELVDNDEPFESNVMDLMNGVRNVEILQLTHSATKIIWEYCKGGLPVFKNLLHLEFLGYEERVWKELLPLMLEHSPNLERLFLSGLCHCKSDGIRIPQTNKVSFLCITFYLGTEHELKHISHFLLKMECLQVVQVYFAKTLVDDSKKMKLTEDLLKLPKASSNLRMHVI